MSNHSEWCVSYIKVLFEIALITQMFFVEKYIKNISENTEINFEHKIAWNKVCERK